MRPGAECPTVVVAEWLGALFACPVRQRTVSGRLFGDKESLFPGPDRRHPPHPYPQKAGAAAIVTPLGDSAGGFGKGNSVLGLRQL